MNLRQPHAITLNWGQWSISMSDDPFATPAIQSRIAAAISRIQSKWLDWIADPTDGDLDSKIVATLVQTLDAYAEIYLSAVDGPSCLTEYRVKRAGDTMAA